MGVQFGAVRVVFGRRNEVRVVGCGIDTLHLFSAAPLAKDRVAELLSLKEKAGKPLRAFEAPPRIKLGSADLEVRSHGAKTASLVLTDEWLTVKLAPTPPKGLPTMMVELRAGFLWQAGLERAAQYVEEVLTPLIDWISIGGAYEHHLGVTRLDLTVDFQGWIPVPADDLRLVRRAKRFTCHRDGSAFTGFSIGHGDVVARLYDKTVEIHGTPKEWFKDIWKVSGHWNPEEPVWRLEFQLRRPALRNFQVDGRRGLNYWTQIAPNAKGLWRYLTTRWLSHREPRTNASRQELTSTWLALVNGAFQGEIWAGADTALSRTAERVRARRTAAHLTGHVARACARAQVVKGARLTVDEQAHVLVTEAQAWSQRQGISLNDRVDLEVVALERRLGPAYVGGALGVSGSTEATASATASQEVANG